MSNNKYLVVKKSDLERKAVVYRQNPNYMEAFRMVESLELPDAEVIRHQDITAAPIFHHYASSINTIIELADKFAMPIDRVRLREIADHFHQAAIQAESVQNKLPD